MIGEAECQDSTQCLSIGLGSKPCGGPWAYVIYSAATVDTSVLLAKVSAYNEFNHELNVRYSWGSDCMFVSKPNPGCRDGRCVPLPCPAPSLLMSSPPVVTHRVVPDYPKDAFDRELQGEVKLKLLVGEDGRVKAIEVISSTDEVFNASAIAAAKRFRFSPAKKDGKPVQDYVLLPLRFRLPK